MMGSVGGAGVNATTPDDLRRAVNTAMDLGNADIY